MAADRGTDPFPPQEAGSFRRPDRPPLTREAVVGAALGVLEEGGARALTMRRVASRLGVAVASLYDQVSGKEELVDLVVDRLFSETTIPDAGTGDWETACRQWLRDCRSVLMRHPGVAALTFGRVPAGPHSLARLEALLRIARAVGLPDRFAVYAGYLFGFFLATSTGQEDPRPVPAPPARSPDATADERFEWGLDVLIRGLATFLPPATGGAVPRAPGTLAGPGDPHSRAQEQPPAGG